jgi:hypothetical protein
MITVGVDVDGLACPLHCPKVHGCQTRGQGLPLGVVLSYHYSRWWHLLGDVNPPWAQIFSGEFTALVPALPNLTWGKLFLLGDAYPMAESS